jgi:hypothetical protein
MFRSEESEVFLQGDDKASALRQSREQLTVLRGGAVNLFLLSVLFGVGLWYEWWTTRAGKPRGSSPGVPGSLKMVLGKLAKHAYLLTVLRLPAVILIVLPIAFLIRHWQRLNISDPPIMEGMLIGFGVISLFARSTNARRRRAAYQHMPVRRLKYAYALLIALSFFLLVFAGWMRTTVSHTQLVIYGYSALHQPGEVRHLTLNDARF